LTSVEAIDAVQEAFLTLLSMPQARELSLDEEGAGRLMAVLVRNAARNMRRRRHRSLPHESLDGSLGFAADTPSVESLLVAAEEHVALLGCVNKLGEVQRQVLTMRVLEELTPEDAANTLGLSSGNVAVLLHRAKCALIECLEMEESDV
jgi:RNA polymerase sigma-70 factor (ECF subfamily)